MKIFESFCFVGLFIQFGLAIDLWLRALTASDAQDQGAPSSLFLDSPAFFALAVTVYTCLASLLSMAGLRLFPFWFFIFDGLVLCGWLLTVTYKGSAPTRELKAVFAKPLLKGRLDGWVTAAFVLVVACLFIKMLCRVAQPSVAMDLIGHLLGKARVLVNGSYRDAFFLHDSLFANLHTSYPPMFALFFQLLFSFLATTGISYFHVVNSLIIFLIWVAVYQALKDFLSARQAAAWMVIGASCRFYLCQEVPVDNADVFLSLFFVLSIMELARFSRNGSRHALARAAIFAAGGALLKNEGIVYAALMVLMLGLILFRTGKPFPAILKALASYLAILLVLLAPWWTYRTTLPGPDELNERSFANIDYGAAPATLEKTLVSFYKNALSENFDWLFGLLFIFAAYRHRRIFRNLSLSLYAGTAVTQFLFYFLLVWLLYGKNIAAGNASQNDTYLTYRITRLSSQCFPTAVIALALLMMSKKENAMEQKIPVTKISLT